MQYVKRSLDFAMRRIGEERFLVPLGAQVSHTNGLVLLNATGLYIWDLLEKRRSREELVCAVEARFEVSRERASEDLATFLSQIQCIGLLEQ